MACAPVKPERRRVERKLSRLGLYAEGSPARSRDIPHAINVHLRWCIDDGPYRGWTTTSNAHRP